MIAPTEEPKLEDTTLKPKEKDTPQLATRTVPTLAGYTNLQTLKIEGFLEQQSVIILIDAESTRNFMSNKVAAHLMLQKEDYNRLRSKSAEKGGELCFCDPPAGVPRLLHRGAVDVVAVVSANGLRGGHLQPDPLLPLCGVATIVIDHTQGQASNQVPIVLSSREEGIRMHRHRQVCVNPRQRILKQEWGIPSRSIVDRSARVAEAERPTSLLDHDRISRFCKFYSSAPLNSRRCLWRPSPSLPTASTPPPIVTIGAPSLPYCYSRPQLLPSSFSPLLQSSTIVVVARSCFLFFFPYHCYPHNAPLLSKLPQHYGRGLLAPSQVLPYPILHVEILDVPI
ncbi:hypothetical protein BHM03_00042525 [Ensete ventricosum]|nr:hypothetical protein BHM03_00042525 [Ensete ventricosum]